MTKRKCNGNKFKVLCDLLQNSHIVDTFWKKPFNSYLVTHRVKRIVMVNTVKSTISPLLREVILQCQVSQKLRRSKSKSWDFQWQWQNYLVCKWTIQWTLPCVLELLLLINENVKLKYHLGRAGKYFNIPRPFSQGPK